MQRQLETLRAAGSLVVVYDPIRWNLKITAEYFPSLEGCRRISLGLGYGLATAAELCIDIFGAPLIFSTVLPFFPMVFLKLMLKSDASVETCHDTGFYRQAAGNERIEDCGVMHTKKRRIGVGTKGELNAYLKRGSILLFYRPGLQLEPANI